MEKFYINTLNKLETSINELEIEGHYSIQRIKTIIHLILECLSEVKQHILETGIKNNEEEILFFKFQKPIIVAKLIYYNAIYKIETRKPYGEKLTKRYGRYYHILMKTETTILSR